MSQPIYLTLITGPSSSGKSTLARIIAEMLADPVPQGEHPRITWADTSACLKQSRERCTEAGLKLTAAEADRKAGFILEAGPVFQSVMEYIAALPGKNHLNYFMLVGSPRTVEEGKMYRTSGRPLRVVFLECTKEQALKGLHNRKTAGETREDDPSFERRWTEYEKKVIPAVSALPEEIVLRIPHGMSLTERIEATVKHMDLRSGIAAKWIRRLHTDNHRARLFIKGIEAKGEGSCEEPLPRKRTVYSQVLAYA